MMRTPEPPTERWWYMTRTLLIVPMPEVERILGRPYGFTAEDDELVLVALERVGAPAWVRTTTGYLDAEGFCLDVPKSLQEARQRFEDAATMHNMRKFATTHR